MTIDAATMSAAAFPAANDKGPAAPQPKRRAVQARTLRTRHAIEQAAIALFAVQPVDAVAIDDIVGAAGVAKGTFYTHFNDKHALLVALNVSIRKSVEPMVDLANADVADAAVRLARGIGVYVRFARDHQDRALILSIADVDDYLSAAAMLNRGLIADLATGLAAGRFAFKTMEAALLFVAGSVRIILLTAARAESSGQAIANAQQMTAMVLRGLGIDGAEADHIAAWSIDETVREATFAVAD